MKWGGQLITWSSTIIIATLLTPEDFGLVAAAMVLIGFTNLARELGLGSAIVQAPALQRRQAEQSMAFSILVAIAAAGFLFPAAPV